MQMCPWLELASFMLQQQHPRSLNTQQIHVHGGKAPMLLSTGQDIHAHCHQSYDAIPAKAGCWRMATYTNICKLAGYSTLWSPRYV